MSGSNIRNREELVRAVREGMHPQYLYFWSHTPLPNGEIGKPCLSQWWPASFSIKRVRYPTAEHFMMAEKARLFGDDVARSKILTAESPKIAKQVGRQVKNFNQAIWEERHLRQTPLGAYRLMAAMRKY